MIKAKYAWKDFNEDKIKNAEDLENYIRYRISKRPEDTKYEENRAYFHSKFFHYTKLRNIDKILSSQSFLISRCGCTNDPMEKDIKDVDRCFALCFSSGINENIPMWYLYSGIDGQGGCLTLTKPLIYDLFNKSTVCFAVKNKDDDEFVNCGILERNKDYNITLQDVLYAKVDDDHNIVDIKYNNRSLHNFDKSEFEKFRERNSAFVKSIAWYYEKETRLLIKLTECGKEKLDGLKKCTGYQNLAYSDFKIRISFREINHIASKINLVFAPEFTVDDNNNPLSSSEIFNKLREFTKIREWIIKTSGIKRSYYQGQIIMQLCKDCDFKKTK